MEKKEKKYNIIYQEPTQVYYVKGEKVKEVTMEQVIEVIKKEEEE